MHKKNCLDSIDLTSFKQQLVALESNNIVVAYSGGMDSRVLLELCSQALKGNSKFKLSAIHINHQIHQASSSWENHCKNQCDTLGVDLKIVRVTILGDTSLETAAREARYTAFSDNLTEGSALLLAHHARDQAETILMRIFRGTGSYGLQGIPATRQFRELKLVRPLLNYSYESIKKYATENNLHWIEDPSNESIQHTRNLIRTKIMPIINSNWPAAINNICSLRESIKDQQDYINFIMDQKFAEFIGTTAGTLSVTKLKEAHSYLSCSIMRKWIKLKLLHPPTKEKINKIFQEIVNSTNTNTARINIGKYIVRRYRDDIYLTDNEIQHYQWKYVWQGEDSVKTPAGNTLLMNTKKYIPGQIELRQGYIDRRARKIFQSNAIPTWERCKYVLIYSNNKLNQIIGLWQRDGNYNYIDI